MSKLTNIGRDDKDPAFRYKMPVIQIKIESAGNGIKTVISNMLEVAKALDRPASYTTKFFACELGSICTIDDATRKYVVNGKHDADTLQRKINQFIERFVLCPKCRLPETTLNVDAKKKRIQRTCICCGHISDVDTSHKLCTFIYNNPPPEKKLPKRAGAAAAAGADEDSGEDFDVEAPPEHAIIDDDDQVEWSVDTSAEAVAQRQADAARVAAVVEGPDETDIETSIADLRRFREGGDRSGAEIRDFLRRLLSERRLTGAFAGVVYDGLFDGADVATMSDKIKKWAPALSETILSTDDKRLFLGCFERHCKSSDAVLAKSPFILKALYDEDILDEDTLTFWFDNPTRDFVRKSFAEEIRKKVEPFITWLRTAEEESDEDSEDSEDDDTDDDDEVVPPSKAAAAAAAAVAKVSISAPASKPAAAATAAKAAPAAAAKPAPAAAGDEDDLDIDDI